MRRGDEQAQVAEWVYRTLTTDQVLADLFGVPLAGLADRTWPDVAPGHTPSPWQVFSVGEALDTLAVGPHDRLMVTVPVNVRVVGETDDPGAFADIARRHYDLMHGTLNAPISGGGVILSVRRTGALNYPEDAAGVRYRHVGGLYTAQVN